MKNDDERRDYLLKKMEEDIRNDIKYINKLQNQSIKN